MRPATPAAVAPEPDGRRGRPIMPGWAGGVLHAAGLTTEGPGG
ncbi:hypothetical protein [Paracraurococcus ruber]|nr:hypothetical protein [Paracraurococcus ruber]